MLRQISPIRKARELAVGSRVQFRVGPSRMRGLVVEDRGRIGKAGRHLLRIKLVGKAGRGEPDTTFELPADELTLAP